MQASLRSKEKNIEKSETILNTAANEAMKSLSSDATTFDAVNFEQLENDYEEVMTELMGDKSLERFRIEYEKLHRALQKSNAQEKRLIKKCRELNAEIINNAAKVQTAIKLSQEDQASIVALKKEMEKAWKLVDSSNEKELRAKDTIQKLKDEISNLSRLLEQGSGLTAGQESVLREALHSKEELSRANHELEEIAKKDHVKLQGLSKRINDLEADAAQHKKAYQELQDQLAAKSGEQERERRRKERMEKELKDTLVTSEKRILEQAQLTAEVAKAAAHSQDLERQLQQTSVTLEKYVRDYDSLFARSQKLTDLLNEQNDKSMQLELERRNLRNDLKSQQDELNRIRLEKSMAEKKIDKEKRNAQKLQQRIDVEHTAKLVLMGQISSMQKDLDNDKLHEEHQRVELNVLEREKNNEMKNVQKAESQVKNANDELKSNERVIKSLETELGGFKQEAAKQRKLIYQLEKESEKYGLEAAEQRKQLLQSEENVKAQVMQVQEIRKKILETENKLKQQQQLYEQVRSERNHYSKNLIESQDEVLELKRKFKILDHQIEQLKEEVAVKDTALVKEHFDHCSVEKERDHCKNELVRLRSLLSTNEETINQQVVEIHRLTVMLKRMDDGALEQRKSLDQIMHERDVLGTQLIRRNDELSLLYEKLKIQQSILSKGEAQYQERMQDVRILKLKISDLKRELYIAKHQIVQCDDLKKEVYHLQRELLQEKTKVKALSEELENPMNVHRWRKLEGNDPETYELLLKIQALQKRLIQKTEQVVEKELFIEEKDKLYNELKVILARQPGPEIAEQLSWHQQALREKEKQLKLLLSEQNMYQSKEHESKYQIDRLEHGLNEFKRKYYKQKLEEKLRNHNKTNHREMTEGRLPIITRNNNGKSRHYAAMAEKRVSSVTTTRFIGGGFSMNQ